MRTEAEQVRNCGDAAEDVQCAGGLEASSPGEQVWRSTPLGCEWPYRFGSTFGASLSLFLILFLGTHAKVKPPQSCSPQRYVLCTMVSHHSSSSLCCCPPLSTLDWKTPVTLSMARKVGGRPSQAKQRDPSSSHATTGTREQSSRQRTAVAALVDCLESACLRSTRGYLARPLADSIIRREDSKFFFLLLFFVCNLC